MFKHYSILWICYAVLVPAALFGLEIMEGNKITTTEYYGMQNIGPMFLFMVAAAVALLYPVTSMPLTMLLNKIVRPSALRLPIYAALGGAAGYRIFYGQYGDHDGYFIKGYGLNPVSGIVIFGAAALLYGVIDWYMRKRWR